MSDKDRALVKMNSALLQIALYSPSPVRSDNIDDIFSIKAIARAATLEASRAMNIDKSNAQVVLTGLASDERFNVSIDRFEFSEKNLLTHEILKAFLNHFMISCDLVYQFEQNK
jgi:hypothetical protein